MNKSVDADTLALHEFLLIDYISDGVAHEHGWVLIQLLKIAGDKKFSAEIAKLNPKELNNITGYFCAGLNLITNSDTLSKAYPISFQLLKGYCY